MTFANQPIAGQKLIVDSIHSPGFVTGVPPGWSINKDGTAEFTNVNILTNPLSDGTFTVTDIAAKLELEYRLRLSTSLAGNVNTTAVATGILSMLGTAPSSEYSGFDASHRVVWDVVFMVDAQPSAGGASNLVVSLAVDAVLQTGQIVPKINDALDRLQFTRHWTYETVGDAAPTFTMQASHLGATAYTIRASHTLMIIRPQIQLIEFI